MKEFFLARLQEPSTWRASIWVLTSFGLVAFKGYTLVEDSDISNEEELVQNMFNLVFNK